MPTNLPKESMRAAKAAVDNAAKVRKYHARRTETNSKQRAEDIELALQRLKEAMEPLRSEIGRFPYGPQTDAAETNRQQISEMSEAIQRERRKLWKMRKRGQTT